MKTRCIYGVAVALALAAGITLFAQTPAGGGQAPAGRGQTPPGGGQTPPAGAQAPVTGPGGVVLTPAAARLLPKAINAPDIKYEVVRDFLKLPPNV